MSTPCAAAEDVGDGVVQIWTSSSASTDIKVQDVHWDKSSGDFFVLEAAARAIFRIEKQKDPVVLLDLQSEQIPEVTHPISLMPRNNPPGLTVVGARSWVAFDTNWSVLESHNEDVLRYGASTGAFGSVFVSQEFSGAKLMISALDRGISSPWWIMSMNGQKRSVGALYSGGLVVLTLDNSQLLLLAADPGDDKLNELFTANEGAEHENREVAEWKSNLRSGASAKLSALLSKKNDQKLRAYGIVVDSRDRIWLVRDFWPQSGRTILEAFSLQGESLAKLSLDLYCPKPRIQDHYLVLAGSNAAGRTVLQVVDADVAANGGSESGSN
jgi:hypothetical protein